MNENERREIQEAIAAADDALLHLGEAKKALGKARNWGIFDILGGGSVVGLAKHLRMGKAEREISEAKFALQKFSKELQDVSGYSSIHINGLLTFADFFMDGLIADIWVQSKISDARRQCDDAIHKVSMIRGELVNRLNG